MMGLVALIILSTFILSIILGIISSNKIKFIYSIIISILFIPSVFIYYNETALVYILWYLIDSYIGIIIGSLIQLLINKVIKK